MSDEVQKRGGRKKPSNNGGKAADGRFAKGNHHGRGRPQGSRNKITLAIDKLLDGEAKAITRKAVDLALEGDTTALRLCMDRICPPRKERSVICDLPEIEKPADLVGATSAILQAVATGTVTPGEGQALAGLIDAHRRAVETVDIERRLAALEKETKK